MIQLGLFRNKTFSAAMVCGFITNFTVIGTIFVMPIFLETVHGYSPSQVALLLAPVALSAAIIGPFGGWVSDKIGFFPPVGVGMFLRGLSFLFLSWLTPSTAYLFIFLTLLINGIGLGLNNSPILSAAVSVSEHDDYGMTAGTYSMVQFIGGAIGVSISSVIVYSNMPQAEALKNITGPVPGFAEAFLFLTLLCGIGFLASFLLRSASYSYQQVKSSKIIH